MRRGRPASRSGASRRPKLPRGVAAAGPPSATRIGAAQVRQAPSTNRVGKVVDWEKLTVAQIAQTLKPSQAWSLLGALAGSLSGALAFAYWLGTKLK